MSTQRKQLLGALAGALLAMSVPVALAGEITLYEHRDFRGDSLTLHRGAPNLERSGLYGGTWRLCSREYYRGECFDFVPGRYENLGALTGRVSSAELVAITGAPAAVAPPPAGAGRVVLYEYPNFRGQSFAINWSELPNLNRMGFSDRAASMRITGICVKALAGRPFAPSPSKLSSS
jgi:hypothetical protein